MAGATQRKISKEALQSVNSRESLFAFLKGDLNWPVDAEDTFTYAGPALSGETAARVEVGQMVPFSGNDPFVIMLAEFKDEFRRSDLREILRGIRADMRKMAKYGGKSLEEIVFVCATDGYGGIRFAHFKEQEKRQPKLSVFGWDRDYVDETRTLREFNLPALTMPNLNVLGEFDWIEAKKKWLSAWDVEQVTDAFFRVFKGQFKCLARYVGTQARDEKWAHDFALQVFSRVMFIYFIQRKQKPDGTYWLGNDRDFIKSFWDAYDQSGQAKDTFYTKWLNVLFFEAFNNRFQAGRVDYQHRFPEAIRNALVSAPFLNGELFKCNDLDTLYQVSIPDSFVKDYLDFLNSYNFTVSETTPFDVEVAVNPEMLGTVYESLVNLTSEEGEEGDERGEAGIFYTPRVEIDLMCRLAVVDWLMSNLGEEFKPVITRSIFAFTQTEKKAADEELSACNLWGNLNARLHEVAVLDPACGSGSFLVGMLLVLDDLQERANGILGINESAYERRKRIIGQSLYGVDCKEWAVQMAELRLWLELESVHAIEQSGQDAL